ncbi:MAG: site-specific DNA-methyltransferase [Calditrichaeota bacterium]|nr:site-specific DNA-methyltransferase [Calditrichota bacterium]
MKAYFSDIGLRLYLGDVITILNQLPEETIDLIFADPPYNLSNDGFTCHAGRRVSVNKGNWDRSKGVEEDFGFHYEWINACKRVLKPNGTLWISGTYHSIYACGFALQKQGWHIINDISWFKPNAAPNLSCRMFTASHETLLWAKKTKKAKHVFNYDLMKNGDWNGDFLKKPNKQMRSVWAINTPKNGEKKHGKHPTQKPEELLKRIILSSSNEGDTVLDPFCGSATTGVVAIRYKRKFVGVDLEKQYLDDLAIPRMKDEILISNQVTLFSSLTVKDQKNEFGLLP